MKAFVEPDCTFTHEGKTFESGGAWLAQRKDTGRYEGILYAKPETHEVTDWHGKLRIQASFGPVWHSAFRDYQGFPQKNRTIRFEYQGKRFSGIQYNIDWSEIVRVKEVRA
jgi:hypothetical protein